MAGAANPFHAYSRATHTVAKTRQVVMLYDGAIRFLQQAKAAMEAGDISERYTKLARSGEILVGLQSCLDFESGGDAAQVLYDFYAAVDMRIMELHRTNDAAACEAIVGDLKDMRDVWDRIDRGNTAHAPAAQAEPGEAEPLAVGTVTVSV